MKLEKWKIDIIWNGRVSSTLALLTTKKNKFWTCSLSLVYQRNTVVWEEHKMFWNSEFIQSDLALTKLVKILVYYKSSARKFVIYCNYFNNKVNGVQEVF